MKGTLNVSSTLTDACECAPHEFSLGVDLECNRNGSLKLIGGSLPIRRGSCKESKLVVTFADNFEFKMRCWLGDHGKNALIGVLCVLRVEVLETTTSNEQTFRIIHSELESSRDGLVSLIVLL